MLTLAILAERWGVADSTLRHQVRNGSLKARKFGPVWIVTEAEAARYERVSLGRHHGRPKKSKKAAVR